MKKLLVLTFILFLAHSGLYADEIELNNGQKITGQLLKVTPKALIVELRDEEGRALYNRTFPRQAVKRVTDDSGSILFEDNLLFHRHLDHYYQPAAGGKLPGYQHLITATIDTFYTISGRKYVGKILRVQGKRLHLRLYNAPAGETAPKTAYTTISLDKLKKIVAVNGEIKFTQAELQTRPVRYYPYFSLAFEPGFLNTRLHSLQGMWQDALNSSEQLRDFTAPEIPNRFPGLLTTFCIHFSPRVAVGSFVKIVGDSTVKLGGIMLRYFQPFQKIRLIAEAGVAYSSVKIVQPVYLALPDGGTLESITWKTSLRQIYGGLGIALQPGMGLKWLLMVRYLPFGKRQTDVPDFSQYLDFPTRLPGKIDLNMWMISTGIQFQL